MIELIFVIVIIGILAAVAIPKLAATRDDAKHVAEMADMATCLTNIIAEYTATELTTVSMAAAPCNKANLTVSADGTDGLSIAGDLTTTSDISGTYKGSGVSF